MFNFFLTTKLSQSTVFLLQNVIMTAAHKQQEQSSKLLQKYSARLSKLVLPMEVTQMLYTEGVISKETFDEIQSSGGWLTDNPLRALSDRVIVDPNMLRAFGTVLLQSKDTVHVGNDILREYGKCL